MARITLGGMSHCHSFDKSDVAKAILEEKTFLLLRWVSCHKLAMSQIFLVHPFAVITMVNANTALAELNDVWVIRNGGKC